MLKYVSIMVLAYREATGKSEEEALKDLAIDDFVRVQDLENITSKEIVIHNAKRHTRNYGLG
ncbi:MAG: hypothetical protein KAT62_07755 [Desulfuromonadales bacterium]|nr:hypothetical protein [Desulfuromonadales bacterium]